MKTDKHLGARVESYLADNGIETPFAGRLKRPIKSVISKNIIEMLEQFNLNLEDDSLCKTPQRVTDMYADELFSGLNYENFPKCTVTQNKFKYNEMVTVDRIPIMSVCEHHLMPIDGYARISYIPNNVVLGLSKFNRVANFFARRPQVQERLTEQIWFALQYILGTNDIAIRIEANHYCMKFRGVKSENSMTTTTKLGGSFMKPEVRAEFLK